MDEYIEREAALKVIRSKAKVYDVGQGDALEGLYVADREVAALPAANVELVRHGRWLGKDGLFQGKCSVCGYMTYDKTADWARDYWPYCPNCGAKMAKRQTK